MKECAKLHGTIDERSSRPIQSESAPIFLHFLPTSKLGLRPLKIYAYRTVPRFTSSCDHITSSGRAELQRDSDSPHPKLMLSSRLGSNRRPSDLRTRVLLLGYPYLKCARQMPTKLLTKVMIHSMRCDTIFENNEK